VTGFVELDNDNELLAKRSFSTISWYL